MLNTVLRFVSSQCRQNKYFIIGLIIGISLSPILTIILDNGCTLMNSDFSGDSITNSNLQLSGKEFDEYKPILNLAGKPQKAQKTPQMLIRPRYYSTELGIREKLFVAVLTTESSIANRAVSINKTLAHVVDKIMYFIDAVGPNKLNVSMPGIVGFTDTRKILKPFHMLKYITDSHLEDYDFFFLMKDSTYVKSRKLYQLVQSISVSEDVHAGSGKNDEHTAFCSLDAGLLLSNSVLRKVLTSLDWCVKNAFSDLDDANIGRCIVHATGILCQDSIQGQKVQSFALPNNINTEEDFIKLQQNVLFESALTIYPVTDVECYKFHSYFSKESLIKLKQAVNSLRHSMLNKSDGTVDVAQNSWPVGNQPGNLPKTRFDVQRWDYFTDKYIYLNSDFTNVKELSGSDKYDIEYVLNSAILEIEKQYDSQLQFRKLINGYRRFDPARGMDYRMDISFKSVSTGNNIHKRIEVAKTLGKVEVVPMPYVTENIRLNLVLPVTTENKKEAMKFMESYSLVCMDKHDKTFLMLVLLYDPNVPGKGNKDDIFLDTKQLALALSERHKKEGSKIAWVSIKIPLRSYSSGMETGSLISFAVVDLVIKKFSPESLILLCESNMELRQDYLNRVRMNTILHWQIFSPIPFSEFHPDIVYTADLLKPQDLDINKNYGHYDSYSVNHIAFYAKDYLTVRKEIQAVIPIVRSDREVAAILSIKKNSYKRLNSTTECSINSLYSMFVCASEYHILRAVEPGLRLRYVERPCSTNLDLLSTNPIQTYQQCAEIRAFNLGFRSQLAHLIIDYKGNDLVQ